MQIVGMDWSPTGLIFTIHCGCDTIFIIPANLNSFIKCPNCHIGKPLRLLYEKWRKPITLVDLGIIKIYRKKR